MATGSHTGSFAGGFIKSFLAVAQMAMRKRQLDDMHEYYMAMRDQMRMNMQLQQRMLGMTEAGRARSRGLIEGFDADNRAPKGALDKPPDLSKADPKVVKIVQDEFSKKGIDPNTALTVFKGEALDGYKIGMKDTGGDGGTSFSPFQLHFNGGLADIAMRQGIDPRDSSEEGIRKSAAFAADWVSKHGWGDFNGRQSGGVGRWDGITGGNKVSAIDDRNSGQAKQFLETVSNHPDRFGDTSNMQPEFAVRMAAAIKQANAEGIPARLESGYRSADELWNRGDRSQAAYFDAEGNSNHTKGYAGDVAGIGKAGSDTARRWAEIANANGLAVPYGYNNGKEYNHTELAGLTRVRGLQPINAAHSMVAGPGAPSDLAAPNRYRILPDEAKSPQEQPVTAPSNGIGSDYRFPLGDAGGVPPAVSTVVSPTNIPIGGGAGNVQEAPTGTPAAPAAAPAAAIPARGAAQPPLGPAPGTVQSSVGGVRGQQPGTGGPIYTTGQFGPLTQSGQPAPVAAPPAPAIPTRTGTTYPMPPTNPREGSRPQQVPVADQPMPPKRPDDLSGATDTSGNIVSGAGQEVSATTSSPGGGFVPPGGGSPTADPLWAGYAGASPDQAASADPLNSLYASGQNFSASAGLTDTSGLMAAGMMGQMALNDTDTDLTAELYKGGPVIRYRRGGVVGYASGGDTEDEDLLAEYGGTDKDDPMANAYWDQQRVSQVTSNSDLGAAPDLTTSIQTRASQDVAPIQVPPHEPLTNPLLTQAPPDQPAAPTEQPTEQPAAPPSEDTTAPPTTTGQSDIPPGSVQVAGPGGWGSVGRGGGEYTHIPMPRVGGMGMGSGMRMPRPSMSGMGGGRRTNVGGAGGNPLYIPGYVSDNDYNHIGIAPTYNPDGSASPWLLNMVGNGVRALVSGFGLMNQGAMPNSPQTAQNLQLFGSNTNPGIPTKQEMGQLGKLYDPHDEFVEGAAEIGGAVSMIKYYALTGQLDAASRLAGGVLLYTRMMSMEQGDEAVKSLFKGDYSGAVKYLEKAHGWVPDGKTSSGEVIDEKTGKVRAQLKDGNGNILDQRDYMPAAIMEAALGAQSGKSYWTFLSGLAAAGNNDPIGSHYQLQESLRNIPGNQGVPPDPFAAGAGKNIPIDGATPPPPTAPDETTAPPISTEATPPADGSTTAPPAATPPATAPAIPPKDAGGTSTGMAVPATPPPTQTAQGVPDRGDTSNLVAGPGAPSTTAQPPPTQGGSGGYLVAREQQAPDRVQQSAAVTRMLNEGAYDPDDPYMRQKIADIDKQLAPLEQYRSQLENQLAEVEASNMNPQDKRSMQLAIVAKIKDFEQTTWKNALYNRNTIIKGIDTKLRQQFNLQKSVALQQQAELNKRHDQAVAYDNQRVAAEQKRQAALPAGHQQLNANDGQEPDGSPMTDKATNQPVLSYGEQIKKPFTETDSTTGNYTNPIARAILQNNPYLSSSYDGKDPKTVDMTKVPEFKPTTLKTAAMISRDIILYNSGDISYKDAQDLTSNVIAGGYTIQRVQHPPIHSMALGDLPNDDGVPRTDVIIGRGVGDQNPMRITMSTANANRLADLATKSEHTTKYNKDRVDAAAMPDDKVYSSGPDIPIAPERPPIYPEAMPQRPHQPRSASNAAPPVIPTKPQPEAIPGTAETQEMIRRHPSTGPFVPEFRSKSTIPATHPWDQPIQ